jgi:formylglycine-generating enzyme required for sulfatase activity
VKAEDGWNNPDWWVGMPAGYQPQDLAEQRTKAPNNPRDSVSWYQSVAFACWLNHRLRGLELLHPSGGMLRVGEDAEIRLPTEWEWQWAAQNGGEAREYPWGAWQAGCADTSEAGLGRAIAVGMYPHGSAVCDALDMAGNLYELCLNDHGSLKTISISNNEQKVLRGGSFRSSQDDAAASCCGYGYGYFSPDVVGYDCGLRLVVAAPMRL